MHGRGNGVLNCGHAVVRRLVVDSLRHWVRDYRLDGFAFLNAEALTHGVFCLPKFSQGTQSAAASPIANICLADRLYRFARYLNLPCGTESIWSNCDVVQPTADRDGTVLDAPPLGHEIAADPELADRRIIAAPADAGLLARSGGRGFPHWGAWCERPAGFAADVVRFLAEGEI